MPADVRPARPLRWTPRVKAPGRAGPDAGLPAHARRSGFPGSGFPGRVLVGAVTPAPAGAVLAATVAAGLSGCGTRQPVGNMIAVSAGACGTGGGKSAPAMQIFEIRNSFTGGAEVDLINPASGAIYAEVAGLGPGTTRPMRVDLGSGRYASAACSRRPTRSHRPGSRIGGHHRGAPAILPVTTDDLLGPGGSTMPMSAPTRWSGRSECSPSGSARSLRAAQAAWLRRSHSMSAWARRTACSGIDDTQTDGARTACPRPSDPAFTGVYLIEEIACWARAERPAAGGAWPPGWTTTCGPCAGAGWGWRSTCSTWGLRTRPGERAAVRATGTTTTAAARRSPHGRGERRRTRPLVGAIAVVGALPGAARGYPRGWARWTACSWPSADRAAAGRPCASSPDSTWREQLDAAWQVLQELVLIAAMTEPRRS